MRKKFRIAVLIGAELLVGTVAPAPAQDTAEAYREGRRIVDGALAAMGGAERLSATGWWIDFGDTLYWRHQSRRPEPPYDGRPFRALWILDRANDRLVYENAWSMPGGFQDHARQVIVADSSFVVAWLRGTIRDAEPVPIDEHFYAERLPHLVLLKALERPAALRALGPIETPDGPREAVIADLEEDVATLFFDPETRRLTAVERMRHDAYAGDAVNRRAWSEWRTVGEIPVPGRFVQSIAGEVTNDYSMDVRPIGSAPDSLFLRPTGLDAAPAAAWPEAKRTELAPEVWLVEGIAQGYNVLVVGFDDFTFLMEAPIDSGVTQRAIEIAAELAPGKPLRYAAVTHHHDDHAGGVRAMLADGATLLTTASNAPFFERVAAAQRTIQPDELSAGAVAGAIEPIEDGRRAITDGARRLELIDIGPSPHADEMLVAWLPEERILFQGDLLNAAADVSVQAGNETTRHFAEWLEREGLEPRVIAGVHAPAWGLDELRRSLELEQSASVNLR